MTSILSLMHFLVDGLCVCLLYLGVSNCDANEMMAMFITYNVAAFLTQPLTGWCADVVKRSNIIIYLSVTMLIASAIMVSLSEDFFHDNTNDHYIMAMMLGLGNSLFHVWGGRIVTLNTHNDIRHSGVYVSTGAMGLSIGMVFFSWQLTWVMLASICLLTFVHTRYVTIAEPTQSNNTLRNTINQQLSTNNYAGVNASTAIVLIMIVGLISIVMFRSFIGKVLSTGIPSNETITLLIGGISMLGKAAGGWFAKWMGIVPCIVATIVLTFMCWMFGENIIALRFAGLFLINLTMPITLYLINIVLQGREGLAFGLLAAALIPGYIMGVMG